MPTKQILGTPTEVAKFLGVPIATLAQWRYLQKGPKSIRVGRHIRYRWGEIDRWLDQQQTDCGGRHAL